MKVILLHVITRYEHWSGILVIKVFFEEKA